MDGQRVSAHAYIQYADVPESLLETARRTVDGESSAALIQFDGYPHSGEIVDGTGDLQIEFVWPRDPALRHALGDWLTHHGISFVVIQ
ncbi:phage portal protein [Paraburkholderia sp.]|uniref:phage portal protein n=1 Tax=Paraburkholderia sp. TaxID=1926495 RepID=UPI0025E414DF|nr:phage portal protein [Paraburkholderia sp.]